MLTDHQCLQSRQPATGISSRGRKHQCKHTACVFCVDGGGLSVRWIKR
jgi:hypothetical protein